MTLAHAVVHTDHVNAQVLQFDAEHVVATKLHAHVHPTAQHGSAVRTQHEFFAALCDALADVANVLVTGPHTALEDLRRYVGKHRPALAPQIAAYVVVDHPTENQLVARARTFFAERVRLGTSSTA